MAKVKLGLTVTGIRGNIGGIVFSANSSGDYAKLRVTPITRYSSSVMSMRQNLAQVGYHWDALTAGQRSDWNDFAAAPNELDYDPWGDQRFLTGYQWFARCAQRRLYVDATWPTDAPTGASPTALSGLSLEAYPYGEGNTTVDWTAPSLGATDALIVMFSTSSHPYAVRPNTIPLLVCANLDQGTGPTDITLLVALRFGLLVSGQKAFITAYNQSETGPRSVAAYASCVIS